MSRLFFLVEQIAPGLYIVLGLFLFLAWRGWMRARYNARATRFELERGIHKDRQANSLMTLVLLVQAVLVVIGIQTVVVPFMREQNPDRVAVSPNITDGVVNSPTPAPVTPGAANIDASGIDLGPDEQELFIRPTLTFTPVGTIIDSLPPASGCESANAFLQVPANGMLVFDSIVIRGTAFTENFAFYRFELNGPATQNNFVPIGDYTQQVTDLGVLGQFVPALFDPGDYRFRLMVFDISSTLQAACEVNIRISTPPPTATPIPPAP
jgi:hypothetical protein